MPALRYTARARRDLIDLWLEVSEVNPAAADELYNRLEARVKILRRFPQSGPARPDIAPEARALIDSNFTGSPLVVLSVGHFSRVRQLIDSQ